jgi:hypothetical protein
MPSLAERWTSRWRSLREQLRLGRVEARSDRVYEQLTREDLSREDPGLTERDFSSLFQPPEARIDRFLGLYTNQGGQLALERYGFLQMLREKGFDHLLLSTDTSDASRHALRIHFDRRDPEHLLVEMVLGFKPLRLPNGTTGKMLSVEWLLMQDPRRSFPPDRPPLPDQQHPGLGLFYWQGQLLRLMATRLECDGLMNNPQQFHNGSLYGKAMKFVDPVDEGTLRALERDLAALPLGEASHAVDAGLVREVGGDTFRWKAHPQILPISLSMQAYFEGKEYQSRVVEVRDRLRFELEDAPA